MTATATVSKSFLITELLDPSNENKKAIVTTDNAYYGMTILNNQGALINVRDSKPLAMTAALLKTKVKFVEEKPANVSFKAFIAAYENGKKVTVELNGEKRSLMKPTEEEEQILRFFKKLNGPHLKAVAHDSNTVLTMEEIINGTFYVAN